MVGGSDVARPAAPPARAIVVMVGAPAVLVRQMVESVRVFISR